MRVCSEKLKIVAYNDGASEKKTRKMAEAATAEEFRCKEEEEDQDDEFRRRKCHPTTGNSKAKIVRLGGAKKLRGGQQTVKEGDTEIKKEPLDVADASQGEELGPLLPIKKEEEEEEKIVNLDRFPDFDPAPNTSIAFRGAVAQQQKLPTSTLAYYNAGEEPSGGMEAEQIESAAYLRYGQKRSGSAKSQKVSNVKLAPSEPNPTFAMRRKLNIVGGGKMSCKNCGATFKSMDVKSLESHVRTKHYQAYYEYMREVEEEDKITWMRERLKFAKMDKTCQICKIRVKKGSLQQHNARVHKIQFGWRHCQKAFGSRVSRDKHAKEGTCKTRKTARSLNPTTVGSVSTKSISC